MIESSFLCSSAWDSDLFQDFVPESEAASIFDAVEYFGDFDSIETKLSSCSETPDDLSSASSSDYEWLKFDDLDNILPVSDTFVSQILEEEGFGDLGLSSVSDCPNKHTASADSNLNNVSSTTITTKWKKKLSECLASSKSWSKMSPDEQLQTLHTLTDAITSRLGIKEQMEIIKIIDPTAIISPDDKEFALECSFLNNTKLRRIKDIVRKHVLFVSNSSKPTNRSSDTPSKKTTNSPNTRFHPTKRRQRKQKIPSLNERERKVKRQGKKEVQSGLFVYEKRIRGKRGSEENEDVNILE